MLRPGALLGHIRVEAFLGGGGMSRVWRGRDDLLGRPVALKTVRDGRRMDPLARARFLREARILSRLDHPGICRIYDLVEAEECDVMVLELVEGRTLTEAMAAGLTPAERRAVALGIADALAAAHAHGIVHRDLKPANVMLTPGGRVKVLDFDLARPDRKSVV